MILLSSSLNSFIQLLGVLLIFLFVLVITYFTTKWIGGYQKVQMSGRSFQVVDTIRIANNKLVQVIKMGDVYLVIAVAKDNVYRPITVYMTGILDKKQALEALKIKKLFNQLVFATEMSLRYLHFEGSELV